MSTLASKKRKKIEDESDPSSPIPQNTSDKNCTKNSSSNGRSNKRQINGEKSSNESSASASLKEDTDENGVFVPLTLDEIRKKIKELCKKVPIVPPDGLDESDKATVRSWAQRMQAVIEEFNLLLCCVANATYKWGSERSGAADQNLSVLSSELGNAQDQISSSVTPRLTNVLAPVVDLVEVKTTKKRDEKTGEEIKVKEFGRELVDPSFLKLCSTILCRNARMLRQVVLTNFNKIDRVILDYQKATKKDSHHDRSFAY